MAKKLVLVCVFLLIVFFIPQKTFAACNPNLKPPDFSTCSGAPGTDPKNNPDINLNIRGWQIIPNGDKSLQDIGGPTDLNAPRIYTLFPGGTQNNVSFSNIYQINDWNWGNNTRNGPIQSDGGVTNLGATMVGFNKPSGTTVQVPEAKYDIGGGYQAVLLFADDKSAVIKYTPSATLDGNYYMIQLENIKVDNAILNAYTEAKNNGTLVWLGAGQQLGVTQGELLAVMRDSGSYMDLRIKKDWWQNSLNKVPQPLKIDKPQENVMPSSTVRRIYCETPGGELGDNIRATCPGNCPLGPAGIQPAPPDYKKDDATATVLEMRDNANLIYGVGVQGMACGQSQSNSIVLTEKAPYNPFSALPPNFCEQPHKWVGEGWIFDIKLPFAQSIADHWVGTYDSEHLTDQQFDQITFQDYWQKIGVLGKLLPAQTKDDLKVEFINYLKNRLANGGVTMYANFVINNKRLVDLNPPSNKTDLRIWANDPINRAILDKMGLFPNEQVLGQVKLDVCGDRESQEIKPSYPEMMKLGLGANQLFKILEPAEAQKAFYTTAYPKLEEPYPILNEYRTLTDAEVFEPKKEIAVLNYPVLEIPKEKNFFEKIISWIKGNVQKTYAVGTSCFDIAAKTAPTKNNDGSTDVNFEISITGNINKGVHMQFFANGSRATQIPKILSPGTTFNFSSNDIGGPVHFPAGSKDMTVDFGVKMDECNDYGNEAHVLCNIVTGECNGVILPSGGGTPKREACDPLIACCPTPTCSPQTRAGQEALSYTIYKGGSDDGSKTNGLNYMLGYEMGPAGTKLDPVDLTWVNNWQELAGTKSLPSGCQFKEGAVTGETCGNNSLCSGWGVDEGCNQGVCQKISIPCTYTHPRDVDVYNNVPYTWSLWEQAASENVGAKYSGFLALFKPELPLNSGIVNQSQFIMACNALGIKTFDPNRYYNSQTCEEKVNPTAREISDGTYISGLVAGMSSTINNKSDDGCYTDDARVFDNQGNFKKVAGQTGIELSWSLKFDQPIPYNNPGISDVTMAIPNDGKSNLLFYGLGGVCNANKWFSQKVLNPAKN